MNCPSGAPPHCVGQVVTRPDGPQVSAQGNRTTFVLDRNIVRRSVTMYAGGVAAASSRILRADHERRQQEWCDKRIDTLS